MSRYVVRVVLRDGNERYVTHFGELTREIDEAAQYVVEMARIVESKWEQHYSPLEAHVSIIDYDDPERGTV